MRIIPVIDVMNGGVVRAVAGRRSEYQPIHSSLTQSTQPIDVALAMLDATGASELYVADLDAITTCTARPSVAVEALIESKVCRSIWLDDGVRDEVEVYQHPHVRPVIGSETLTSFNATMPEVLFQTRPLFSLDLQGSALLTALPGGTTIPLEYVKIMIERGYRSFIIINLDNVGMGRGVGTELLIQQIQVHASNGPAIELYVGGGIRNRDDISRLADLGVTGVLVSSAIHTGEVR